MNSDSEKEEMFDFLRKTEECTHEQITPDIEAGYCPDCGQYVENEWFLSRCGCCGIKQKTIIIKGRISPQSKFCRNCGSSTFIIEKINKINFIDINYAIVIKSVFDNKKAAFTQSWAEPKEFEAIPALISLKNKLN